MKQFKNITLLMIAVLSLVLWSCNKDDVDPSIDGLFIEAFDLIQLTNESPNVRLTITASDNEDIKEISTKIYTETGTEVIASNTLRQITNNINRITLSVPFPNNEVAPSGRYRVEYTIIDEENNTSSKELIVNILNYITEATSTCEFPSTPLPTGKNTWVRVIAPNNTGDDDVYVVGDFMEANGAEGNWNPGNNDFKMNRVPGSNCFYIALNLTAGQQIKFVRGGASYTDANWGRVMKDENGRDFRTESNDPRLGFNGDGNIQWGTAPFEPTSVFTFTVPNWSDRVVPPPSTLPSGAIQTGKITTVVDINTTSDASTYYLVPVGSTNLNNAVQMLRVSGTSKVAGAVPKTAGVEYIIVKDEISKVGVNSFGYDTPILINGQTNPREASVGGFKTEYTPPFPTNQLLVVGGATPAGWNNSASNPQSMTQTAPGKFTITFNFANGNGGFLIIPVVTNWDSKIGKTSGNFLGGNLGFGAGDFDSPGSNPEGMYKLDVDLVTATYKLTPQ
jgi:hypothetical protein